MEVLNRVIPMLVFCGLLVPIESELADQSGRESFKRQKRQVINDPPVIITNTSYSIQEDDDTMPFSIVAQDPDGDDFVFMLDPNSGHRGTATLDTIGQATYKPCPDCFGTDEVAFIVRETIVDPLETSGTMIFYIEESNDPPVIVSVKDGEASSGTVNMIVDQYQDSDFYSNLKIILVSYDVDMDSVSVSVSGNQHGAVQQYSKKVPVNVTQPDCSLAWDLRRSAWDAVLVSILTQGEVTLPIPCGTQEEVEGKDVSWAVILFEYTPNNDFLGMDSITVQATDDVGVVSEMLTIDMYVLSNPCMNNATCLGPSSDTDCTDTGRVNGFDDYTCDCVAGFTGSLCEEQIDECLSSPCPANYSCVDETNAYQCICKEDWPCADDGSEETGLDGWLIGVISVAAVLGVLLIIGGAFCVYRCWNAPSHDIEKVPFIHDQGRSLGIQNRERNLLDSRGKPLQVVSPYDSTERRGRVNRAFNRSDPYVRRPRSLPDSPRYTERVIREEPSRRRRVRRSFSDRSVVSEDYARGVSRPVKRWTPRQVDSRGLYSSEYRPARHDDLPYDFVERNPPKIKRLRRGHSFSDISPRYA